MIIITYRKNGTIKSCYATQPHSCPFGMKHDSGFSDETIVTVGRKKYKDEIGIMLDEEERYAFVSSKASSLAFNKERDLVATNDIRFEDKKRNESVSLRTLLGAASSDVGKNQSCTCERD